MKIWSAYFLRFWYIKVITRAGLSLTWQYPHGKKSDRSGLKNEFLIFQNKILRQSKRHKPGPMQTSWNSFRTGAGGKPSTWLPPGWLVEHLKTCKYNFQNFQKWSLPHTHTSENLERLFSSLLIYKSYNQSRSELNLTISTRKKIRSFRAEKRISHFSKQNPPTIKTS